jgi:hypothetical protein
MGAVPVNEAVGVNKAPETLVIVNNPERLIDPVISTDPVTTMDPEVVKEPVTECEPVKYSKFASNS